MIGGLGESTYLMKAKHFNELGCPWLSLQQTGCKLSHSMQARRCIDKGTPGGGTLSAWTNTNHEGAWSSVPLFYHNILLVPSTGEAIPGFICNKIWRQSSLFSFCSFFSNKGFVFSLHTRFSSQEIMKNKLHSFWPHTLVWIYIVKLWFESYKDYFTYLFVQYFIFFFFRTVLVPWKPQRQQQLLPLPPQVLKNHLLTKQSQWLPLPPLINNHL